jgi:hypothetical protein
MKLRKYSISSLLFAVALLVNGSSVAQQPFAYPNAGQTEAQQGQDRYECHQWSVAQSGFDPSSAAPLPARPAPLPPPPPQAGYSDQRQRSGGGGFLGMGSGGMFQGAGMLGDAATGAALGAAGGALAGDAGKGAAVGALAGTALGAFTRGTSAPAASAPPPSNDYYYQQQQAQAAQADQEYQQRMERVGEYNRAFSACMTARNYIVN